MVSQDPSSNVVVITVEGAAPTITLSATPTTLGSQGGSVTLSGSTDYPQGTSVSILNNLIGVTSSGKTLIYSGHQAASATVSSSGSFTVGFNIPANDSSTESLIYEFYAVVGSTQSNTVDVTVANASITITANTTSLPSSGGTVSFTGSSNYDAGVTLTVLVNGSAATTVTTSSGGSFSFSLTFPSDPSTSPETYSVEVTGP